MQWQESNIRKVASFCNPSLLQVLITRDCNRACRNAPKELPQERRICSIPDFGACSSRSLRGPYISKRATNSRTSVANTSVLPGGKVATLRFSVHRTTLCARSTQARGGIALFREMQHRRVPRFVRLAETQRSLRLSRYMRRDEAMVSGEQ
jgi:hypothetical protein